MSREARTNLLCFVGLAMLAAGSYGASFLGLGWARIPVALTFSVAKAALVLVIFMELRHRPFTNRFVGVAALTLVGVLLTLVATDFVFRDPAPLLPADVPR